jgi:antitoxin MazE
VRTRIIKIGNSQGVRIPKVLLEQAGLGEEVELVVQNSQVLIRAMGKPRRSWEETFRAMTQHGDDRLVDEGLTGRTLWDEEEWEW